MIQVQPANNTHGQCYLCETYGDLDDAIGIAELKAKVIAHHSPAGYGESYRYVRMEGRYQGVVRCAASIVLTPFALVVTRSLFILN